MTIPIDLSGLGLRKARELEEALGKIKPDWRTSSEKIHAIVSVSPTYRFAVIAIWNGYNWRYENRTTHRQLDGTYGWDDSDPDTTLNY